MLKDLQILVAEDAPVMRFALTEVLRRHGACVDEADTGKSVLDLVSRHHYDLLLLDVEMPELDGLATTRRLRKWGYDLPIIGVCGNADEMRETCLYAGMVEVLPKPCPRDRLLESVLHHGMPQSKSAGLCSSVDFNFPNFLQFCDGDEAFMHRLLAIAAETLPTTAQALRIAADNADTKRIATLTHRVRPSVEGLGLSRLAYQLRVAEQKALKGTMTPSLATLIADLSLTLEEAAAAIQVAA